MIVRRATPADIPELEAWLGPERDYIHLRECECFVAEDDGKIVGMLPARLVWELEPGLVRSGNRVEDSRALLGMYRAAEAYIATTLVRQIYTHTISTAVKGWAERLGWHRLYRRAAHYTKFL